MVEGMCAHQIVISDQYVVYSCSKMFQDGSSRKVRVLSLLAREDETLGQGSRPKLVAE